MNKLISKLVLVCIAWTIASAVYADPAKDQKILGDYLKNRFEGVPVEEYAKQDSGLPQSGEK